MVCLEKLDRSDFEEVYRIMEQSFPADERRKKEGQQKLLDEEKYELLGVRNEGGLLAFFSSLGVCGICLYRTFCSQ